MLGAFFLITYVRLIALTLPVRYVHGRHHLTVKRSESEPIHYSMFVRPRDPARLEQCLQLNTDKAHFQFTFCVREIWDGPRSGVEGALSFFGADEVSPSPGLICIPATRLITGVVTIFVTGIHCRSTG